MTTYYLALDPGHSTGWASFNEAGIEIEFGTVHGKDEIDDLLIQHKPTVVICEEWVSQGNRSFGGDKMVTIRIIGRIELWCKQNNATLHMQPNTVKPIAYLWAGIKKAKNKDRSHELDAYAHGVYWLQKAGIRKPQQGRAT